MARRWLDPETAADLGRLDPEAIARVRAEAWPEATNADELHDALVWLGFLTEAEVAARSRLERLAGRACRRRSARRALQLPAATLWIAAERLPQFHALWPERRARAADRRARRATPSATGRARRRWSRSCAAGWRAWAGHGSARSPRRSGCRASADRGRAGGARGRRLRDARPLHAGRAEEEWCERRLLARIHRYTIKRLRARSSRSPRATSCASCSTGSTSRRTRAWRGPMRSTR